MNLLEQIREKAKQAKDSIGRLLNPQGGMKFPTTSQDLSKSTEIAQRESDLGYYNKQGGGIIQGEGFNKLKNKLGLNYQDAQISSWQEGLKSGSPKLAALKGNYPAAVNVDFTSSMAAKKPAQQVAKKIGQEIQPVAKNIIDNITSQAKKFKNIDEFISSQISKDYRSPHQIKPTNTISVDKIDIEKLKLGIKEKKGWINNYDLNDLNKLKRLQNNPEKEITIYRASPVKELNEGDWVTADRIYANDIKRQNGGKVYSYKVKVKDLRFPNDIESLPSASMASAFQYNPRISELTDIFNKANKPQNVFEGFKDISTRLLEDLKGKSTVNKSFIEQRLMSSDLNLKQVEKDLIRSKLANYPDRLDVKDFAENIKTDLLPLNIAKGNKFEQSGLGIPTPRYESITLPPELRGNVQNYAEHIYESPIKTSAGKVHFGQTSENYFGHTRVEDLADSSLGKALKEKGGTRRVIEVQSDLYQKGRLENEFTNFKDETLGGRTSIKDLKQIQETNKQLLSHAEKNGNIKMIEELNLNIKNTEKKLQDLMKGDYQKLSQYSDPTAHYRLVREEVKLAAQDGKTKLQFPTGETAMKIEGLGDNRNWITPSHLGGRSVGIDDLKIGNELSDGGTSWIITDVLEDGKFKAVPKNATKDAIEEYNFRSKEEGYGTRFNNLSKEEQGEYLNEYLNIMSESFDVSGKIDTNNPIYKFYEKNLGKYLKSKYDAKLITDKQGVNWYELDIKPEWKNLPVEAFGFSSIQQMVKTGLLIGGGLVAQDVIRNKKKEPTREEALEALKQRRNDVALEKEDIHSFAESITPQVNINKRIEDDGRWVDLIKNNSGENVSSRLLSALLMTENRGTLAADSINENIKKDGTKNYDVGLFQHNSPVLVDKNEPVEEREYQGTQKDMNKLFKAKYGRNYDVYNPEDNTKATVLFVQDLIRRTGGKLEDVIGSYNKGVRGHSLSPNQKYIDTFIGYYNE